jgi:hypothetical protein
MWWNMEVVSVDEEQDEEEVDDLEEVEVQTLVGLTEWTLRFSLGTVGPWRTKGPTLGGVIITGACRGVVVGGITLRIELLLISLGGVITGGFPLLIMCHLFLTALSERPLKYFDILAH